MKIGTKSVLFGAHQFIIHPLLVALGWWKLYGFPFDLRLWFAFFIHDLGYIGKPNMDGPEGDRHMLWGAWFMGRLFGREWHDLCLYHSRFFSKKHNHKPSRLCFADKLCFCYEIPWLYIFRTSLTGELYEYLSNCVTRAGVDGRYASAGVYHTDPYIWFANVKAWTYWWVSTYVNGKIDTWTTDVEK